MKTVVVFIAVLSVAFTAYPDVQTWSRLPLEFAIKFYEENPINPGFLRCLETAFEVMADMYDDPTSEFKPSGVVIPAPSGAVNWTVRELTNALNIIAMYEGVDIETRADEHDTSYWTTDEIMELMFTTTFPDPLYDKSENRMIREINDCIMLTMYYINQNISKYDLKKDKFPVLLPAVDISTWTLPELNKIISKSKKNSDLLPYLQKARKSKMQQSDDGKKYCVITPVGKIPQKDPYYYLPEGTRRLLKMAKVQTVKRKINRGQRPQS